MCECPSRICVLTTLRWRSFVRFCISQINRSYPPVCSKYSAQLCCGSIWFFCCFSFPPLNVLTRPTTNDICGAPERKVSSSTAFQFWDTIRVPMRTDFGLRASRAPIRIGGCWQSDINSQTVRFGSAAEKRKTEVEKRRRGDRGRAARRVFSSSFCNKQLLFLQV